MHDNIIVKGAREHNLKDLDVTIPKNNLTVVTGLSGSGKSTLAFDTLYAEGQRRYVESLSAYARQFLGLMNKPDVDSIEGLSPAIAIEQKTTSKNPRSTVGTVTEIYDYLRLLFARIGTPYCPDHAIPIVRKSAQNIAKDVLNDFREKNITLLAPLVRQKKGTYEKLVETLRKEGYAHMRVNGDIKSTQEALELERYKKHDIEVVIDKTSTKDAQRVTEGVENALKKAEGLVVIVNGETERLYSQSMSCPECGLAVEELQPRMFSFNAPFGACKECHGLGFKQKINPELIIPNKSLSIIDGALAPYRNVSTSWTGQQLSAVAKHYKFNLFTPIEKLTKKQREALLFGSDNKIKFKYASEERDSSFTFQKEWEGVVNQLERLYKETKSDYRRREIEKFMSILDCKACHGKRLNPTSLAVKIADKNIIDLTDMSVKDSLTFFKRLELSEKEKEIAKQILKELNSRLSFLNNVGLDYLTLSRSARTLSGGEAQRIRLATQIGANLTGVMYVLDEPSIGLHQRDNNKLIETLKKLRDIGNTLIVVEHDEDTIREADHVIDLGPGAGFNGGYIVAKGTPKQIEQNKKSLTGQYLSGEKTIPVPSERRKSTEYLSLTGVTKHNLKNITTHFPTRVLTVVSGVSGSGKSTLIYEVLYKALKKELSKENVIVDGYKNVQIPKSIDKLVMIDQSPIGRTPRSNPATYTKVFDDVRNLFSQTKESKLRGYQPGRFSFNVSGGRCETCQGDGLIKIEMHFLPDVYVTCEECKGARYNDETLEVYYKGKNISEVLDMSVEEALDFFYHIPKIYRKLKTLQDVGLTYVKLGQSSTTLSGGEAQRIKLTRELAKRDNGNNLYLLDEPTTGLHFDDVKKLILVLQHLVNKGNTIIVIEHNLDIIKNADHILDLGPEGGNGGGRIIAQGTPEHVAKNTQSHTGAFLKRLLP
ncbi:excinuclease ABC subunit UvrA [archaeon CG10_big_fil_rev_8_21_14_0_10_43_11]|nr:MAG: excinuclease ABC subunit UvrA [archaeon CG10_big_fil_rev_8_21_14_0_10_43_11]